MKQKQHLFENIPGSTPQLKHHDLLSLKSYCLCSECDRISDPVDPQIVLDQELKQIRSVYKQGQSDFVFFLDCLKKFSKQLPRIRLLETIVMKGENSYSLHFEENKLRVTERVRADSWILERKQYRDLKYQIERYQRENNFNFTAFEHTCQKKIKEFESNIKYKIAPILNKTAILKLKTRIEQTNKYQIPLDKEYPQLASLTNEGEVILSKSQFEDMFDANKARVYNLQQIEYIQVFPVMSGEEEHSYIKIIKYERNNEFMKKSFKLAEMYVCTWFQKNDSLQKLEEGVFNEIAKSKGSQVTEDDRLFYQTYKLFIFFEQAINLRVKQALVYYITNDDGQHFFFKSLECLQTENRAFVDEIGVDLPAKKEIAPDDYINLGVQMKRLFNGFQDQFFRLNKERQQMDRKIEKDRQLSNKVFERVSGKGANLHEVLVSRNQSYKKKALNL